MSILIYDLETSSQDASEAIPRIMGFKTSYEEGFKWTTDINEMIELINQHKYIVGYNSEDYDNEILKRYGASFYGKINLDLMKIIHGKGFGKDLGRKMIITTPKGEHLNDVLPSKKLKDLAVALQCPVMKLDDDFDYSMFKREWDELSGEEKGKALIYLKHDVEITEYVYKYVEDFFENFRNGTAVIDGVEKKFMKRENINRKQYLTWSTASLVYHVICNLIEQEPVFSEGVREFFDGGFVVFPEQDFAEGDIYCLDYASLYPHLMILCNLYGRVCPGEGWKGEGVFETKGTYDRTKLAPVSKVLQELYKQRVELKKAKNPKEYTIKIIINTVYGLLGNPVFSLMCDFTAAADCTRLGRQFINEARLHFRKNGYELLYTDTDSVYLRDSFNDKERLLRVKQQHIDFIKSQVPFPQDTFDMDIDEEIKFIAFFKGASGNYLKKNYLYVTKKGKLEIKGLPIIKSTATVLGKTVFDKYIKPEILNNNTYKFPKSQIAEWIEMEIKKDKMIASVNYRVKHMDVYASQSQIQYQISKVYGEGDYNMLKLRAPHEKGVGVRNNYIRVEDADDVRPTMIDISKTWQELNHFVSSQQKSLEAFC